ncbi:MAG: chorismate-binding protein, partial [Ginsengibacter sp.]
MKRIFTSYTIADSNAIKNQVLNFGNKFSTFCFLDSHEYNFKKSYDCIAGIGLITRTDSSSSSHLALNTFDSFQQQNNDWIFGHLSYDIKNEIEDLSSSNFDGIGFPDIFFFVPQIVFIIEKDLLRIGVLSNQNADDIFKEMASLVETEESVKTIPKLKARYSKEEYLETVCILKNHISRGDCYEVNFCQEIFADYTRINPLEVYQNLGVHSPNPFSAFYKCEDKFLMCASPERYLKKEGRLLTSQPIKGTAKRIFSDFQKDLVQKESLKRNKKERAENTMIVDLVRNDLSKICEEGSVKVDDFLEVYTFPQVHQMISSISGILRNDVNNISEIFRASFPMGSMTGAPKKRVMELIEKYE